VRTARSKATAPTNLSVGRLSARRPVAIDLFSGAGGMSLGFEQAGFDVLAAVEYDPVHAATHCVNLPLTEMLCRDLRRIDADDVRAAAARGWRRHHLGGPAWSGQIDAVFGGPSCQGFSIMGSRDQQDERNQLLDVFVQLVIALRPRSFCIENVPGLLESRFSALRSDVFERLADAGYHFTPPRVFNAADFGVPQTRKRVLILGALEGCPLPPVPWEDQVSVAQAFDGLPCISDYPNLLHDDEVRLRPRDMRKRERTTALYARQLAGLELDPTDLSRSREWGPRLFTCSRRTVHRDVTVERFYKTPTGSEERTSRAYRLHPDQPAHTLRAGTGSDRGAFSAPRPIHPTEPRVVTVREAARLHSFPDWFRFHTTNWHGHRQIGNAVPPRLARAAALSLLEVLKAAPSRPRKVVSLGDLSLLRMSTREAMQAMAAKADETPPSRWRKPKRRSNTRVAVSAESSSPLPADASEAASS
jgi:DNA (cytosine-5)-methyltransferase 1